MMVWSDDPKQGCLTKKGIEQMRSTLTNEIFRDELLHLYRQKDLSYKDVVAEAREAMGKLIREMASNLCDSPVIEQKMVMLSELLADAKGKKVYGYLKKPAKKLVDEVVDELAKLPEVAECYEVWNRLRDELECYYKDTPRERRPLSQQKEFRAIKNAVIREAENIRLGVVTFEDERMRDEVGEEQETVLSAAESLWEMALIYRETKDILDDDDAAEAEKEAQVRVLEQLWQGSFTVAAHQLGKCYRDGLGVMPDDEKAEAWFRKSAETGNDFSQYTLGKLLQQERRIKEAMIWYEKAAENGNQYAQYTLGKLYLMGDEVKQDRELAHRWFCEAAAQGNEYAQFFLEHFDEIRRPSVFLATTKLLRHMGQIFRENSVPPAAPVSQQTDRKLRRRIREKKIALGHKPDDHEEQVQSGPTMSL